MYITFLALVSLICYSNVNGKICVEDRGTYFPPDGAKAIAVLNGATPSGLVVSGIIKFSQPFALSPITVSINVTGLREGQGINFHGLHIHQKVISVFSNNVTEVCGSTGGHFNPCSDTHGDISSDTRHVGDFGNFKSDNDGNIVAVFKDSVASLYGSFGIIGRTIVLHWLKDDLGLGGDAGSLATGNSGARIACGVIGILN